MVDWPHTYSRRPHDPGLHDSRRLTQLGSTESIVQRSDDLFNDAARSAEYPSVRVERGVVGRDRSHADREALADETHALEEPINTRTTSRCVLICPPLRGVDRVEIDVQVDARHA